MSLLRVLETAKSAMMAHRTATTVTAHNIANANTPGYSRQTAVLEAQAGRVNPNRPGPLTRTGVDVAAVSRAGDELVAARLLLQQGRLGTSAAMQRALETVETTFNDLGDQGIAADLSAFFNAWEAVATSPDQAAPRAELLQRGTRLAESITSRYADLEGQRRDLNADVLPQVQEINDLAREVAQLNGQIAGDVGDSPPNDLIDQRETRLLRLAELAGTVVLRQGDGSVDVLIGGQRIVQRDRFTELATPRDASNDNLYDVALQGHSVAADLGGSLRGTLIARDERISAYEQSLNEVVQTLVAEVNSRHQAGFGMDGSTTLDFFDPASSAADLRLSDVIAGQPGKIGASASGAPGDGAQALSIAGLRDELVAGGGTASIFDLYDAFAADIATDSRDAALLTDADQALLDRLTEQREAVAGVSLDEEAINLTVQERAYEAAARVAAVVDNLIGVLLSLSEEAV
jgi:flagellar hook-associated protein 1 FlgK